MTWLWKCDSGWSSRSPAGPSAVRTSCCGLVCYAQKYHHVTHLLRDVHWLRVPERIQFRLAVIVFRCRNNMAPPYLLRHLQRTDETKSLRRLRSGSQQRLIVYLERDSEPSVTALSVWWLLVHRTVFQPVSLQVTSLASFKRQLKTFLFTKSFS